MKTGTTYDTIKIPSGLTKKIDEMIKASDHSYTSRTDIIKTCVRKMYDQWKISGSI